MSNGPKVLYIDIEAAPAKAYVWGLKTHYIPIKQVAEDGYVLCFSYTWDHDDYIYSVARWDRGGEKAMIEKAWKLLDAADVVIQYNGDNYDLPRLNTEFLRYRLGPPSPYFSVDLYRTVSRKFRVLSKSMQHMLEILGLDSKMEHKGMELWTGCMDGVQEDRDIMEEYNIQDVAVMIDLYHELRPWITNAPNNTLWMEPGEEPRCRCGSTDLRFKGYKHTKTMSYKQYHCQECGFYPRERYAEHTGKNARKDVTTW